MCKVFTSPKRLEILNLLRDKELSVSQLVKKADIRQANISQHLSILRERGIVKTRRAGKTVYYSLANPKIIKAFDIIRDILRERIEDSSRIVKGAYQRHKK